MPKETVKTFLLFFCLGGIIILSVNTYILVQNQTKILYNQEHKGLPAVLENAERLKNVEGNLTALLEQASAQESK